MCDLGHVSRAGLYRFDPNAETPDDDLDLRDAIQRIALEWPCYGRPRITAELKRRGWEVKPQAGGPDHAGRQSVFASGGGGSW